MILRLLRSSCLGALILLSGCNHSDTSSAPIIEFTSVPRAEPGDPQRMRIISGRVTGALPNQRIVLYAQTESRWWVQPYADQPFTKIEADSTWKSVTHPGQEFAALLVGPGFRVTVVTGTLPAEGVITTAVTKGLPPVWKRWWFLTICGFAGLIAVISYHLLRLKEMKDTLSIRFEDRLAERTRVAQLLHDTLLQSVISASLQLHVAVSELPPDSPGAPMFQRVLQSMRQVVEEGRNTLRGLQFPTEIRDLAVSFSRIAEDLNVERDVRVHVNALTPPIALQPALVADLYNIGRHVLAAVLLESGTKEVRVELRCSAKELWLSFRHDGRWIDPLSQPVKGSPETLSDLRERVEKIGARLTLRSRWLGGNKIVLRVPSHVAFGSHGSLPATGWFRWFRGWAFGRPGGPPAR